jgi:hypothetical protein
MSTDQKLLKLDSVLKSMSADIAYINQQLAIHEKQCIKENVPFGDDWLDTTRRLKTVLLEVASLA